MERERDFLCAMGRRHQKRAATVIALDDDAGAQPGCPVAGGAPAPMQWQFPAKPGGAAPAFVSFRTQAEDEEAGATKEFSISGFRPPAGGGDAFDGIKKHAAPSSPAAASYQRRQFGFDAQQYGGQRVQGLVDHRVPAPHHPLGGSRMVQPLSSRRPVPFNQANPVPVRAQGLLHNNAASGGALLKTHQPSFAMSNGFGGSTVGAYGARNPRSQNSTQLTIFYNGTVNVFDNVSVEKAQELMMLASKASISSLAPVASQPNIGSVRKPDSPVSAPAKINVPEAVHARQVVTQKPEPSSAYHLASASSPISTVPQSVALLARGTSNCAADSTGPKTVIQPTPVVVPTSQSRASSSQSVPLAPTPAAAVMSRAVPQARKASLARFLERRKERVTSVEPYPTSKSPLESRDTKGSASALSKSSSFSITPTNSTDREPLHFGQPRNISFSSEVCPSTKLQI